MKAKIMHYAAIPIFNNRNTRTVLVESGTPATLATSMLYTEQYL